MGTQFEFQCQQCDFKANVSGGADFGFDINTQTMFCFSCDALCDVITSYRGSLRDRAELDDGRLNRCPRCHGKELIAWSAEDACPLCNGEMLRIRVVMDWD